MGSSSRIEQKQKKPAPPYYQWITQFSSPPKKEIFPDDIYFHIASFCSIKELHKNSRVSKKWQTINKKVWAFFDVEICYLLGEHVITTESDPPRQRIAYPVIKTKVFFSKKMQESLIKGSTDIENVTPLTDELNLAHSLPISENYNAIHGNRHAFWFKAAGIAAVGFAAVGLGLAAYHRFNLLK